MADQYASRISYLILRFQMWQTIISLAILLTQYIWNCRYNTSDIANFQWHKPSANADIENLTLGKREKRQGLSPNLSRTKKNGEGGRRTGEVIQQQGTW